MKKWRKRAMFILGFLLCLFPIISNVVEQWRQKDAIATYQQVVKSKQESEIANLIEQAEKYNSLLFQFQGAMIDQMDLYDENYYNQLLDCTGTGIMGNLEIPKIDVNLPIYHGTGEDSLANGVGHLLGTSLPVGGQNTHSVLSGHRGLPSSKLLVRLDEIDIGDYFYIRTGNQILAYRVEEINVVEPDDSSKLKIQAGEDLVSLVTCTPYGLNTQRLIVTGTRVEYEEQTYESIEEGVPSFRELLFTLLPFVLVIFMVILNYTDRRRLKIGKVEEDSHSNRNVSSNERKSGRSKRKYTRRHCQRGRKYRKRYDTNQFDRRRTRHKKRRRRVSVHQSS